MTLRWARAILFAIFIHFASPLIQSDIFVFIVPKYYSTAIISNYVLHSTSVGNDRQCNVTKLNVNVPLKNEALAMHAFH